VQVDSPVVKELLDEGSRLESNILSYLGAWPRDEAGNALYWRDAPVEQQEAGRELVIETRRWFNSFAIAVGSLILHDRTILYHTLRQVEASIRKHQYQRPANEQGTPWPVSAASLSPVPTPVVRRMEGDIETRLEVAKTDARRGMNFALDLIKSTPPVKYQFAGTQASHPQVTGPQGVARQNTAFILMSMDKKLHDLEFPLWELPTHELARETDRV
jgi:hypothetical protein